MANDVKIVLTATDQASAVIAKAEGSLKGINTAAMNFTNVMGSMNAVMGVAQQAIAAVGKAYDATVGELMDYAKEVRDVARYTGVSTEEASKFLQIADDLQIETATLKVGFRNLNQQGIQPTIGNIKDLAAKYQALKSPVDKAKFAMEMFGARSGMELAKVLELSTTQIDEMAQSAEELGLVLSSETIQATEEYRLKLDELNDQWLGIKIGIGQQAIPALMDLLTTFEKFQAIGEEGWLPELTGAWWDLFVRLSYGAEITRETDNQIMSLSEHSEALAGIIPEVIPVIDNFTSAVDGLGAALDPAAAYAKRLMEAVNKTAESMEDKMMAYLNFKLLMEDISQAQYEAGTQAVFNYTKLNILSKAYEEGKITTEAYFKIVGDNIVTTEELNTALYGSAEQMKNIRTETPQAERAMANYANTVGVDIPPASQLIANNASTVESLANAWLRVPREVTTTYKIKTEGGIKTPPGVKKQHGGPVSAGAPYIVGEAGPEMFVPNRSGQIIPNNRLSAGGDTIIIHNHGAGAAALTMAAIAQSKKNRLMRSIGGIGG